MTITAFVAGGPAYGAMTILPIAARRQRCAQILADRWHRRSSPMPRALRVLIGFLLLAVFGLA